MSESLAQRLGRLAPAAKARVLAELSPLDYRRLLYTWEFWARPEQRAPAGDWSVWFVDAGRGFGKTRSGAEYVRQRIEQGAREVAIIGPTVKDIREQMVGDGTDEPGEGILNVFPPEQRPIYLENRARIVIPAFPHVRIRLHTAEDPEFRGPNTDTIWCDEMRKWTYAAEIWPNIEMTLRKPGKIPPRVCVTTTPKDGDPTLAEIKADPDTVVTKGTTLDNAGNLDPKWLRRMIRKYAGTRLGLQELFAQELDASDALFSDKVIERHRGPTAPKLRRAVVAVDPQGSTRRGSDDTGIVVAGEGTDAGHAYVLEDVSGNYKPEAWGLAVIQAFCDWDADTIVVERDYGGDLVRSNLTLMAQVIQHAPVHAPLRERLGPKLRRVVSSIVEIRAKHGKQTRAEPVSAAYAQGRVHHVGKLPRLERQLVGFDAKISSMANKDAFDACVYACWEILKLERGHVDYRAGFEGIEEANRQMTAALSGQRSEASDFAPDEESEDYERSGGLTIG